MSEIPLLLTFPSALGRHEDSEEGPEPRRRGTAIDRPGGTAQGVRTTDQGQIGGGDFSCNKWAEKVLQLEKPQLFF